MKKINVFVIEPDQGRLKRAVEYVNRYNDCEVIGVSGELNEFLKRDSRSLGTPQVLIASLDNHSEISMRDWAVVRSLFPSMKVVALTSGNDSRLLEQLLAVGVMAIYPPEVEYDELKKAMNKAIEGELTISHRLVDHVKEVLMSPLSDNEIRVGGLIINTKNQEAICGGKKAQLTLLEYRVLMYLVSKKGAPASTSELLEKVWSTTVESGGTADQVKSCIRRLRRKIELEPKCPRHLRSIQDRGYILSNPIESNGLE